MEATLRDLTQEQLVALLSQVAAVNSDARNLIDQHLLPSSPKNAPSSNTNRDKSGQRKGKKEKKSSFDITK